MLFPWKRKKKNNWIRVEGRGAISVSLDVIRNDPEVKALEAYARSLTHVITLDTKLSK